MVFKKKVAVLLFLMVIGILYLCIEFFFPRDYGVSGNIDGTSTPWKLEKIESDSKYYIYIKDNPEKSRKMKLECTREQYDFIVEGREYHILYRIEFFNRSSGKILKLDDKPIYDGNNIIALN